MRGGAIQTPAGKDVGQRRRRCLASRPRILGDVAKGPSTERHASGRVVLAGQDLEQARLARAVAPDKADLVSGGHGEARVRDDPARNDIDGKTSNLEQSYGVPAPIVRASPRARRPGAFGAKAGVKGPGASSSRTESALLVAPPFPWLR